MISLKTLLGFITPLLAYIVFVLYLKVEYSPPIKIHSGLIRGIVSKSRLGNEFYNFLGIPYAQPPINDLRFMNPVPVKSWDGVRDTSKFGNKCTQVDGLSKEITGSEDCLFLNVFVPKKEFLNKRKMAVIFYIHGGYFMVGTSSYMGPEYLMDEDIILVTLNYRLNVFGFLNTEDFSSRGNFGLKDQNMALNWVQKNIHNFYGDSTKVTIAGQSAGSAAVHFHTLSSQSRGLFSSAIMLSGTAIKPWSLALNTLKQAKYLGNQVNCLDGESTINLVKCLRSKTAKDLIHPQIHAIDTPIMNPLEIYAPSIETCSSEDPECFLTEHPYDTLLSGKSSKVPILTGVAAHEGLLATGRAYVNSTLREEMESNWMKLSPNLFFYTQERFPGLADQIKRFYVRNAAQSDKVDILKYFQNITNAFSDRLYIHATKETVKIQSKYSPVYTYYFNYPLYRGMLYLYDIDARFPVIPQFVWKEIKWFINEYILQQENLYLGVGHGDDLALVFKYPVINLSPMSKDFKMSRQLVKLWVEFARNPHVLRFNGKPWPSVQLNEKQTLIKYMLISNDSNHGSLIDEPFAERLQFWDYVNLPWKF